MSGDFDGDFLRACVLFFSKLFWTLLILLVVKHNENTALKLLVIVLLQRLIDTTSQEKFSQTRKRALISL